jgi:cytochrome c peroxidase
VIRGTAARDPITTLRSVKTKRRSLRRAAALGSLVALVACESGVAPDPNDALIAKGEAIFFEETFEGNGRTCGTCHRREDNFGLTPAFIAGLPDDDPLFVAETNPKLAEDFEKPRLMRGFGLILENLDGFDDLRNRFVLRGVPHTLALRLSVASPGGPRTGWSGDGAPGDGSLRSFAVGAVIQHFPRTLGRVAGVDFRLPTEDELDALEAFMLSLGRQEDPSLPLPLRGAVARRGQELFLDDSLGKCNLCHRNAGANARLGGVDLGNASFDTGVEDLPDQPADLVEADIPADDGFGIPGDGTFNTPPLVEAADTGPFFHNNAVDTLEAAVAFYDGDSFNDSPAGRTLAALDPEGLGIELDATQIEAIAAFLRVLNALENIRSSRELLAEARARPERAKRAFAQALEETGDAIDVLAARNLHRDAIAHLESARRLAKRAARSLLGGGRHTRAALRELDLARDRLVAPAEERSRAE